MNPMTPPRVMIAQFDDSIRRGERYLLPSSRILGAALASLILLLMLHSNESVSAKKMYYGAAMLVVMQVAWFEIKFIFPINHAIRKMGEEYDEQSKSFRSKAEKEKLLELLNRWKRFHTFRILAPLIGASISTAAIL